MIVVMLIWIYTHLLSETQVAWLKWQDFEKWKCFKHKRHCTAHSWTGWFFTVLQKLKFWKIRPPPFRSETMGFLCAYIFQEPVTPKTRATTQKRNRCGKWFESSYRLLTFSIVNFLASSVTLANKGLGGGGSFYSQIFSNIQVFRGVMNLYL